MDALGRSHLVVVAGRNATEVMAVEPFRLRGPLEKDVQVAILESLGVQHWRWVVSRKTGNGRWVGAGIYVARDGSYFWRANSGQRVYQGKTSPKLFKAAPKGTADILGVVCGIAVALEVKRDDHEKQDRDQIEWQRIHEAAGGVYAVVRSPSDAHDVADAIRSERKGSKSMMSIREANIRERHLRPTERAVLAAVRSRLFEDAYALIQHLLHVQDVIIRGGTEDKIRPMPTPRPRSDADAVLPVIELQSPADGRRLQSAIGAVSIGGKTIAHLSTGPVCVVVHPGETVRGEKHKPVSER